MIKRKTYRLKAGNLSGMKLHTLDLDDPAPDEVTVGVKAIGLNFADIFAIWGLYSATPTGLFTPGLEYCGVVLKTGSNVKNVRVGDQVMGVTRFGAYTSHLHIDSRYVLPLPEGWSLAEGASFLVQVLTAYYALVFLGDLKKGQTVLVHSAAGGVGLWANRIAKKYGAYTIGTVGNPSKLDLLHKEGCDRSIVRNRKTFRKDLRSALQDRELHLIMESIGGRYFKVGYELLAPQGRHVVYGSARYGHVGNRPNYLRLLYLFLIRPKLDPQQMPEQNKAVMGFNLIWLYHKVDLMHQLLEEIAALNLGKPVVGHTFSFEQIHEAIRLFQSGKTVGKVVITLGPS